MRPPPRVHGARGRKGARSRQRRGAPARASHWPCATWLPPWGGTNIKLQTPRGGVCLPHPQTAAWRTAQRGQTERRLSITAYILTVAPLHNRDGATGAHPRGCGYCPRASNRLAHVWPWPAGVPCTLSGVGGTAFLEQYRCTQAVLTHCSPARSCIGPPS